MKAPFNWQKYHYLPFWSSFLATLIVLGCCLSVAMLLSGRTAIPTEADQPGARYEYQPNPTHSQNVLLIGAKNHSDPPAFFMLLRFDVIANRCFVVTIPPQTPSTVNVKTMTLAEHYEYGNAQFATQAVENLFLISVRQYVRMDEYAIEQFVDTFSGGGITFNLPQDIQGSGLSLSAGNQLLDGARVATVLLDGDPALTGELTALLIQQVTAPNNWNKKDQMVKMLFEITDTSYTSLEIANLTEPLRVFFEEEGDKVEQILLDGQFDAVDAEFLPNEQVLEEISRIFS